MFNLERRTEKIAPVNLFMARMLVSLGLALGLVLFSLALGMAGYHWIAGLSWIDSFLEAAMILGGEGPIAVSMTGGAKVFAGLYAMYCGLLLIALIGILLTPVAHRMMHSFHIDKTEDD